MQNVYERPFNCRSHGMNVPSRREAHCNISNCRRCFVDVSSGRQVCCNMYHCRSQGMDVFSRRKAHCHIFHCRRCIMDVSSRMQGLSVPFACVGSSDPVRVLRLYTTNTLDVLLKHLLLRHMYNLLLPILLCYAQALRSETSYCYRDRVTPSACVQVTLCECRV